MLIEDTPRAKADSREGADDKSGLFADWLTEEEYAAAEGVCVETVQRRRRSRDPSFPPFVRDGRIIRIHGPTAREHKLKRLVKSK